MKIDKQEFIASLGGPSAVDSMNPEAQADAIEDFMMKRLNKQKFGLALKGLNEPGTALDASGKFPSMAEVEAQIETRSYRRGVGNLSCATCAWPPSRARAPTDTAKHSNYSRRSLLDEHTR